MRKRHSRQEVAGFTLIEIMVSMVLTGILVAGVVGLWGMVGEQFFRLSLRQKAVFVLHGQMERIAQLYRSGGLPKTDSTTTSSAHPSSIIFLKDTNNPATNALIETESIGDTAMGEIFYWDQGAVDATPEDRNFVWLDDDKNIVAQLSWTLGAGLENADQCYGTSSCQILTLYLDYPYRFNSGTPAATQNIETISLQTIVGQWSGS